MVTKVISGRVSDELYEDLMKLNMSNTDLINRALKLFANSHENNTVDTCIQDVYALKKSYEYQSLQKDIKQRIGLLNEFLTNTSSINRKDLNRLIFLIVYDLKNLYSMVDKMIVQLRNNEVSNNI